MRAALLHPRASIRAHADAGAGSGASDAAVAARGSSFYAAMRILPASQREAMMQIYAFCRAVDDIADGSAPRAQRSADLDAWRRDIARMYLGREVPERLASLARIVREYECRQQDFDAILDGMLMDAERDIRAPDWATLDLYCDRVASAPGRLAVRIFGIAPAQGEPLAHHLGRALQLTNILRDLDEDAEIGRLYLPREALDAAAIASDDPQQVLAHPHVAQACTPLIARARSHFAGARAIMDGCGRAAVRSPRLMAYVYEQILDRIDQRGFAYPRRRVRLGRSRLLLLALYHGVI